MNSQEQASFNSLYQQYINELSLQGKLSRTIENTLRDSLVSLVPTPATTSKFN